MYNIYFIECPSFVTNGEKLLNKVITSLNDSQPFNTTHLWCTCATTPQSISLNFTELVHLTRLRVKGSLFTLMILVGENKMVYSNINGVSVSINIYVISYICCYQ